MSFFIKSPLKVSGMDTFEMNYNFAFMLQNNTFGKLQNMIYAYKQGTS